MGVEYAAVPQSEQQHSSSGAAVVVVASALDHDNADDEAAVGYQHHGSVRGSRRITSWYEFAKRALVLVSLLMLGLVLGFCVGRRHPDLKLGGAGGGAEAGMDTERPAAAAAVDGHQGLLPPSAFVPEIPLKGVQFTFPTPYEDTGVPGDMLWNALMPKGSGFVRVPNPRQYDMPASKPIENDPDNAEIYSLSALHQLHCLGVIRDVVIKYSQKSFSRFAGSGHEYHCIDYLRQSIMCAGDMTLDFAEAHADGTRRGFTGANSTHTCRDWDRIVEWAVENREGDKMGIA